MESTRTRNYARSMLNNLMYSQTEEIYAQHFANRENQFPSFFIYIPDHWLAGCTMWVRAWKPDATFDTNSYIESYDNQLKTCYFGRTRNTRFDRIIYNLSQVFINDYRQEAIQVQLGIKSFHLTKKEKASKKMADDKDIDEATYMVIENNDIKSFISKSFTNPDVTYTVSYDDNNCLSSCSCPDHLGLCKHIFLVSRVKLLPYHSRNNNNNMNRPSMPYEETKETILAESQQAYESTLLSCKN